jgi:hypothetical protein
MAVNLKDAFDFMGAAGIPRFHHENHIASGLACLERGILQGEVGQEK